MVMTAYTTIAVELQEGVAEITLNRPEAANALNAEMARELHDAVLRCDADQGVRAVSITGSGRFFCAGGDLKSFAAQGDNLPRHLKQETAAWKSAVTCLR